MAKSLGNFASIQHTLDTMLKDNESVWHLCSPKALLILAFLQSLRVG